MVKFSKIVMFLLVAAMLFAGIIIANVNLEEHTRLVEQEKLLQTNWVTFSLDKDNESIQIIKMQAFRVETLEGKLEDANKLLQDKSEDVLLREQLLVSTATKLQTTIDDLSKLQAELDSSKYDQRILRRTISRLDNSLQKARLEITRLKKPLKSKKPVKAPHPSFRNLGGVK